MRGVRIGYVSDVEGHLDYWKRYVSASEVLEFGRDGDELVLREDSWFVYGGDAVDKGPGDIRLCRSLARLKRRYPFRVFLLVGNRDLNKLRMSSEVVVESPDEVAAPHWDRSAMPYAEYLREESLPNDKAAKCRWLLEHTLGCPKTFEWRREELEALGLACCDEAVATSFETDASPGGALREYLELANVAVRIGSTLFVHGAVDALSAGFVPPLETRFAVGTTDDVAYPPSRTFFENKVDDWIAGLDDLLRAGLAEHARQPQRREDGWRGGEALMALQNRCAVWGRSVVSNAWADGGNVDSAAARERRERVWAAEPSALAFEAGSYTSDARDPRVAAWLRESGITRVVSGHRPVGDSPAVLSSAYHGVEMVCADTSYSDTTAPDNRGKALAAFIIEGPDLETCTRSRLKGVLSDGRLYDCSMPYLPLSSSSSSSWGGDALLGTVTEDGWWFKAVVEGGKKYLQSRGEGRRVEYRDVPRPPLRD
ncbi:hypothetical protein CTAYLR_003699 [Chrysophaeum taylorii]|uniref:Calcineurin-like phosphoesterase domain-containing protein n=1 Tax=Chrysophaeum taylorii TaxID=2483200 RepID=A0AAD7UM95_9STRA|nr:hypothetical protein CTAYLR_003699 [Chrysophaeum taylorii]